jgi:hypothetical protein
MTITYNDLNRLLCAVITTLDEVDASPESALYLGTGNDPENWQAVRKVLEDGNLATFDGLHIVRLTPEGHAMAAKINEYMRKHTPPGSPYNERRM